MEIEIGRKDETTYWILLLCRKFASSPRSLQEYSRHKTSNVEYLKNKQEVHRDSVYDCDEALMIFWTTCTSLCLLYSSLLEEIKKSIYSPLLDCAAVYFTMWCTNTFILSWKNYLFLRLMLYCGYKPFKTLLNPVKRDPFVDFLTLPLFQWNKKKYITILWSLASQDFLSKWNGKLSKISYYRITSANNNN